MPHFKSPKPSLFQCISALTIALAVIPKSWSQNTSIVEQDWVPKEQLTEEQAGLCPTNCSGAYIAPELDDENAQLEPNMAPIQGEADSSEINTDQATALMEGNVNFTQGWRQLKADRVFINRETGEVSVDGNVEIREPGIALSGEKAEIDSQAESLRIDNAEYLFHEQRIRGMADSISRSSTEGIVIDNATYTACEPGDEAWVLYADELAINEETGRASAKGVKIEAAGLPVFYAPYFQFIVDDRRATGILYPEIGYSSDEGFQYRQPIYINLAENQDMTITPAFTSKRGSGLEAEYRLLTDKSYTTAAGAFYPDDDINPVHTDNRWMTAITHRGNFGNVKTRVDLQEVSDDDFLDDWGTDAFDVDNRDIFLRQHADISYQYRHWTFAASATDYQNLIEDEFSEYKELPRISADGYYTFNNGIAVELNNEWTSFDHSLDSTNIVFANVPGGISSTRTQIANDGTVVTGDRLRSDWAISLEQKNSWGYITPKIGAGYLSYELDSPVLGWNDDSPDALALEASVDAGLVFEKQTSLFGQSGTQTLEPRFYYLYRNADDQWGMPVFDTTYTTESLEQLFRDSEFVGSDRFEEASRASIGLWSRFYNPANREVLSLGIGQSYYLRDRETSLTSLRLPAFSAAIPNSTIPSFDPNVTQTTPVAPIGGSFGLFMPTSGSSALLDTSALLNSGAISFGQPILVSSVFFSSQPFPIVASDELNRNRNRSDIITEAKWNISNDWSLKTNLFWDDSDSNLERSRIELKYAPIDSDNFLKFAYQQEDNQFSLFDSNNNGIIEQSEFINQDIEQVAVSGSVALSDRWNLVFLWQEDIENSRNLDKVAGLSYESCCWNISLSWQDQLQRSSFDGFVVEQPRRDKSVVLSFEFKGLGGIGTSARNLVRDR